MYNDNDWALEVEALEHTLAEVQRERNRMEGALKDILVQVCNQNILIADLSDKWRNVFSLTKYGLGYD